MKLKILVNVSDVAYIDSKVYGLEPGYKVLVDDEYADNLKADFPNWFEVEEVDGEVDMVPYAPYGQSIVFYEQSDIDKGAMKEAETIDIKEDLEVVEVLPEFGVQDEVEEAPINFEEVEAALLAAFSTEEEAPVVEDNEADNHDVIEANKRGRKKKA
jgi:hypothetical protein